MNAVAVATIFETVTPDKIVGWFNFGFSALVALAGLILVHEYGHFIVARLLNVRVEKFSIGFGAPLFKKTMGGTEYSLSWIPLGGYVKFYGDDPDSEDVDDPNSFLNQPVGKRLAIVSAGPIFNLLLAVVIVTIAAMIGFPESTRVIDQVIEEMPAKTAGFQSGDRIDSINDTIVEDWGAMVEIIQASPGKELTVGILRGTGERLTLIVIPTSRDTKTLDGKAVTIGQIGITPRGTIHVYPPHKALMRGVQWTWDFTGLTLWSVSKLVSRDIPADQIAGPIGIMKIAGQAAEGGFVKLLMFIALISINLGVLNLLPIPVLDGGHIVFFSLEAIMGRPVKMKIQELAQQVGIFLLLSLMAFAFYNDIMRLVG